MGRLIHVLPKRFSRAVLPRICRVRFKARCADVPSEVTERAHRGQRCSRCASCVRRRHGHHTHCARAGPGGRWFRSRTARPYRPDRSGVTGHRAHRRRPSRFAPFISPDENDVTGAVLCGFALGWAMLAVLSVRFTDQPQRWAGVPALFMGVGGLRLIAFGSRARRSELGVAPGALALAVWMLRARRQT